MYRKMTIYFNLSKQVQKLSLNDLYCCLTTKKFQLKIICCKFVKCYTFKHFEPQNIVRIEKNFKKTLFVPTKKIVPTISLIFFYIMTMRVFPLQNKKK